MNTPSSLLNLVRSGLVVLGFFATALLFAASIGEPAPTFTLTDLAGKTHHLADFKGKTVVLEWTNPECPFVRKHYAASGNLPAIQKAAAADGVVWLLINSSAPGTQGDIDAATVKAWLTQNHVAATAYLLDRDGKVGKAYGAKTTPHLFVLNAGGVLVYQGAIDNKRSADAKDIVGAENYVKSALAALKAGQPIATPSTQPYGCGVKY